MWYCGGMTNEQTVSAQDVADTLVGLEPGATYPAADLYERYAMTMRKANRPAEHPTSLGHALAAYGCQRIRIRKRVGRQPTEKAGWRLPGEKHELTVDPVAVTIETFRVEPGFHGDYVPEDDIYSRYLRLCSAHGWGTPMPRPKLLAGLNRLGRPRSVVKGRAHRYLPPVGG